MDAHSLLVVCVRLLDGQAVLRAHVEKDCLQFFDILCMQHKLFTNSYQLCMYISPGNISQQRYSCTRTIRHFHSRADGFIV